MEMFIILGLLLLPIDLILVRQKVLVQGKRRTTKPPVGVWSSWGEWDENCSTTCGIGVRRRGRTCSYTGSQKRRRCKGNKGEVKNCDTQLTCPVDGGWSVWTAWDCPVSCGTGTGRLKRTCSNPKPMFGGKDCDGPTHEEGKCNEQKCPDQIYTLSPGSVQALKDSKEKIHISFEKSEGSFLTMQCDSKSITHIYVDYPTSVLFWTKNGDVMKIDHERMQISPTELSITELQPQDSGVYLCSMLYAPGVVKTMSVISIAVKSKSPNIHVRANGNLTLICHSAQLYKIYNNLLQTWSLNGTVYKEFGNTSSAESNIFRINRVLPNMTGTWTCKVTKSDNGWTWITNRVSVRVLPAVHAFFNLEKHKNSLLVAAVLVFLIIISAASLCSYKITKAREEYMYEFKKWRWISLNEDRDKRFPDISCLSEEDSPESSGSEED